METKSTMGSNFSDVGSKMSLEELISKLKALKDNKDIEDRHMEADQLLLDFINIQAVEDAFDDFEKWYA